MEEIGTSFLPIPPSTASPPHLDEDDPKDVLNSIHPPRPDWYEELFAFVMAKGSKAYETQVSAFFFCFYFLQLDQGLQVLILPRVLVTAISTLCISNMHLFFGKVAGFKSQIFTNLRGKDKTVLELGIGTGPNLKYYASDNGVRVFGIDPNRKMEKYAQAAAAAAGLPPENFKFIHAVLFSFHMTLFTLNLV
ncbi:hypothetical protein ACSBR2_006455 [Camellia fascicularis]